MSLTGAALSQDSPKGPLLKGANFLIPVHKRWLWYCGIRENDGFCLSAQYRFQIGYWIDLKKVEHCNYFTVNSRTCWFLLESCSCFLLESVSSKGSSIYSSISSLNPIWSMQFSLDRTVRNWLNRVKRYPVLLILSPAHSSPALICVSVSWDTKIAANFKVLPWWNEWNPSIWVAQWRNNKAVYSVPPKQWPCDELGT